MKIFLLFLTFLLGSIFLFPQPILAVACTGYTYTDTPVNNTTYTVGTNYTPAGWSTFCSGPNSTNRNRVDLHICDQGTWTNCRQIGTATSQVRQDVINATWTCGNLNPNPDGWYLNWTPNSSFLGAKTLRVASINDSAVTCVIWDEKNLNIVVPTSTPTPTPTPLPQPTNLSASCTVPGTTGNLSWNTVSGATFYSVYAQTNDHTFDWTNACTAPNFCNRVYSPSATFTTVPGKSYNWFVTAGNINGENSAISGPMFTCTPNTTPTSTPTPIPSTSTPIPPTSTPTPTPTSAPANNFCADTNNLPTNQIKLSTGLLSARPNNNYIYRFYTPDYCIISNSAVIPSFSIPSYADMEVVYYDKSKLGNKIPVSGDVAVINTGSHKGEINDKNIPANKEYLFNISGNLTLDGAVDVKRGTVIVVFVYGNLNINANQVYNNPETNGLVFVVSGNINVAPTVTEINAVMITYGTFCSNWNGSACISNSPDLPLTIKGNVISLSSGNPPKFIRSLANNTSTPAETVIYQPKYLVILKNIFSKTLTIWKEVQ
ncbi:MAG: hypothetical protein Q7R97_02455 [Candidatus Daviesbacteria bacterium]|nr:hypothetical protein [Candidatus Daviesbacteria bacterium]